MSCRITTNIPLLVSESTAISAMGVVRVDTRGVDTREVDWRDCDGCGYSNTWGDAGSWFGGFIVCTSWMAFSKILLFVGARRIPKADSVGERPLGRAGERWGRGCGREAGGRGRGWRAGKLRGGSDGDGC